MAIARLKHACACCVADGLPRRVLYVALMVGTVLNLINQGDALLGTGSFDWLKVGLTFLFPYAVCTYGAVSQQLRPSGSARRQKTSASPNS